MLISSDLSQKRVSKNDGVRCGDVFIDQSEDKLHGKTLYFTMSSWDFMLQTMKEP